MNRRTLSPKPVTRRGFLKGLALSMTAGLLPAVRPFPAQASAEQPWLFSGVNYPWIAYGVDFGKNGWGHAGISTSGWTHQTYQDSRGFTATRVEKPAAHAHSGTGALAITANFNGLDPTRKQGEVYVDLTKHAPRGVNVPLNMTGKSVRCWLYLPPGSAGSPSAPNGVQLFLKSKAPNSDHWSSWYSPWVNIDSAWENSYHEFSATPTDLSQFPGFDPASVVAAGLKIGLNGQSTGTLTGTFYLDDFQLSTNPPVTFDFEQLEFESDLTGLTCATSVLRVFVFCDGRAAPEFGAQGAVASPGFDDVFFQDFDALLQAAARRRVQIIPVLLDFSWCNLASTLNGVVMGGHSAIIRDASLRQSFLQNALQPLVERYAQSPQILAWEIMNEPEWAIQELAPGSSVGDQVTLADMKEFVTACAARIHAINPALPVTLGSARRKWVEHWKNTGLDLYQFHWYDHFAPEEVFPWQPYAELGLDKPCFIGEVPTARAGHSTAEYLAAAKAGGYHGLLVWSYRAGDDFSNFAAVDQPLGRSCVRIPMVRK